MGEMRQIVLPEELCRAAEQRFLQRFQGLDEMIAELLKQLLHDDALVMDEKEQKLVEERLKGLGYI